MSRMPCLRENEAGTLLEVHVQPKASRNEIAGLHQEALKIRLTAPPVEGEANKECIRFLARLLGIPKSDVEIVKGHKSRRKTLLIRGKDPSKIQELLWSEGKGMDKFV